MTSGGSTLLPGYRDFTEIARGRDTVVYRARRDGPGGAAAVPVAVKVVLLHDPESIARLGAELASTVPVSREHPDIVTVQDTGLTADGHPVLVTDFAELGSLHDRLVAAGPLPISDVVAAASVVADALAFAHAQDVHHGDVTPRNILVLSSGPALADFGLAHAISVAQAAPSPPRFDYRHASPQLLDGAAATVADDIYAVGSTVFTLLDGRAPFAAVDAEDDSATADHPDSVAAQSYRQRARTEAPRNLDRADVPDRLGGIIARCLAKRGTDRFAGAADLRAALATVLTESTATDPAHRAAATHRHDPTSLVTLELPVLADAPGEPPTPAFEPVKVAEAPAAAPPRPRRWYERRRGRVR